jgi:glucosamine-6-phosphate deaminase
MKGLIRQSEAVRAAAVTGVPQEQVHFLNMPFYETGLIKKGLIDS